MDYHNIVIAIDWNSNSYYAMTANVKLTDNSFDKYIANTDARKVDWNHPELLSYYENIPAPQRGKIMTSKKRGTDFLNKRGMIYRFSSLVAIVSQKFIDVLNEAGVARSEYILKEIEIINGDDSYYMFFVPFYDYDTFDLEKTLFINRNNESRHFTSCEEIENNREFSLQSVTLVKAQYSKHLINCRGIGLFVSDCVLSALKKAGIKGFDVNEKYQLNVSDYGQPSNNDAVPSSMEAERQVEQKPESCNGSTASPEYENEDELFDRLLTELFVDYFSRITALRKHEVLLSWNFDNPEEILKYVMAQPETDIATAQMIYWRMEPESVRDCEDEDGMPILEAIEQNIKSGFYANNGIAYNPRDDEGYDAISNNTEHTPEEAYLPELLKTRCGKFVEGITDYDGIPEELYPEYASLIRSLGLEDVYL